MGLFQVGMKIGISFPIESRHKHPQFKAHIGTHQAPCYVEHTLQTIHMQKQSISDEWQFKTLLTIYSNQMIVKLITYFRNYRHAQNIDVHPIFTGSSLQFLLGWSQAK